MGSIGQRIKERRTELGMSQEDVAKKSRGRVSQSALSALEIDKWEGTKYINILANILGVTDEWLATGHGYKTMKDLYNDLNNSVPVLQEHEVLQWCINSSKAIDIKSEKRKFIANPKIENKRGRQFSVLLNSDSMTCAGFSLQQNTILVCDPDRDAVPDDFIIGFFESTSPMVRQYKLESGKGYLKPLNSQYPALEMTEKFTVLAVVAARVDIF